MTVQPVESGTGSGTGNSPVGGAGGSSCAPQVTVTVPGEAKTVTVVRHDPLLVQLEFALTHIVDCWPRCS